MHFLCIGYGSIGKRHSAILRELGHTIVSVDPNPQAGSDYYWSGDMLLSHEDDKLMCDRFSLPKIDGVIDATPPDIRAGWKIHGIPHFVEKPLGNPHPKTSDAPVQMGFCYHWLPSLQQFIEQLADVRIYSFMAVSGHDLRQWHEEDYRLRYHGDSQAGGVINDCLPHSLYLVRRIFGDIEIVGCVSGRLSGLEISSLDTVALLLRSQWGTPIFVMEDYLRSPRETYCEAVTSDGTLRWEFDAKEAPQMYQRQMEVFVEICQNKRQYGFPGLRDGVAVQQILDQIKNNSWA